MSDTPAFDTSVIYEAGNQITWWALGVGFAVLCRNLFPNQTWARCLGTKYGDLVIEKRLVGDGATVIYKDEFDLNKDNRAGYMALKGMEMFWVILWFLTTMLFVIFGLSAYSIVSEWSVPWVNFLAISLCISYLNVFVTDVCKLLVLSTLRGTDSETRFFSAKSINATLWATNVICIGGLLSYMIAMGCTWDYIGTPDNPPNTWFPYRIDELNMCANAFLIIYLMIYLGKHAKHLPYFEGRETYNTKISAYGVVLSDDDNKKEPVTKQVMVPAETGRLLIENFTPYDNPQKYAGFCRYVLGDYLSFVGCTPHFSTQRIFVYAFIWNFVVMMWMTAHDQLQALLAVVVLLGVPCTFSLFNGSWDHFFPKLFETITIAVSFALFLYWTMRDSEYKAQYSLWVANADEAYISFFNNGLTMPLISGFNVAFSTLAILDILVIKMSVPIKLKAL